MASQRTSLDVMAEENSSSADTAGATEAAPTVTEAAPNMTEAAPTDANEATPHLVDLNDGSDSDSDDDVSTTTSSRR